MLASQVVSVTDLRQRTKEILDSLSQGRKYIFSNNKPRAVLMSADEYEQYRQLLLRKERNEDRENALKHGKAYTDVDEFMKDLFED